MLIIRMLRIPKIFYKKMLFQRNAACPDDGSTTFGITSFCKNETGDKSSISIGHHCDIDAHICANGANARITIGNYSTVRYGSVIGAVERIDIGNHVIISNHVTIYDNNNHPTDPEQRIKMTESGFYSPLWRWTESAHKPIIICDNVWIGEKTTILKGVTIGEGAVVGCNAVVTKDVSPYTVVVGNPARCVKSLRNINQKEGVTAIS